MDVEFLSRMQFAGTIAFHYIFPPISIGLGLILVIMEAMWIRTKNPAYREMTKFWGKIFGLTFALGVATGVVMVFEFGTNWARYDRFVGDVFGSPLAAEAIFAFFLESSFLAVVLFGWDRVKSGFHFFATCMVCLGAHLSAVWIIVANSWQQTPAGYHIVMHNGQPRAEMTDFWAAVFNPSFVDRLTHTLLGAYLTGAFLVLGISAYYLLRGRHPSIARTSTKIALIVAAIASILQAGSGHHSAIITAKYQPAKLAAFEGHYQTGDHAPLYMFGYVDEENERVVGASIPSGLSLLVHSDPAGEVQGLNDFAKEDRPPIQASFQAFHLMVMVGCLMIEMALFGLFLWWRGTLFDNSRRMTRWYLISLIFAIVLPQIGNQMGWFAAEVGRQPWLVYGELRTSDGFSEILNASHLWFSIILLSVIYLLLGSLYLFLLGKKIAQGPEDYLAETTADEGTQPHASTPKVEG